MGSLQDMLLRSVDGSGSEKTALISAYEAEQLIQQLRVTSIEQVGDAKFIKQHDAIQKLNLQAHWNAQQHTDEFVMDLLVSLDKVSLLVQELLVIEAWKEHLYPLLKQHLADHVDSSISYLVLYHEAAVANLLEVVLYHRHACEAVNEDSLLELADWGVRKLAYLNTDAHKAAAAKGHTLQETLAMSTLEELEEKRAETNFATATCGLTILRYLTDHITQLPLGLMSRLLSAQDAVMALLPLVDSPPWVRDGPGGKLEKFIDGKWQAVAPSDRLKITQLDAQVWLLLVNLLVEPACRAKYDADGYRKGCILRLQRHLHELLMDQLPVLRQLARVLDELSLGVDNAAAAAAAGNGTAASRLILEQVPVLREALLKGKDWRAIAMQQRKQQFGAAAKALAQQQLQSMMQSLELMCQIEEQREQQQKQQQQGAPGSSGGSSAKSLLERGGAAEEEALQASIRVVCSRQVHTGGLWEPWCEFSASLDPAKPSEPVSISTADSSSSSTSSSGGVKQASSSSGSGGVTVHGRRYRLAALNEADTRALPTKGKVAVHFMGGVAEALLQLPEVPFSRPDAAEAAGVPPGLWLTVGLLAADGFALQLRLRKADKPKERDRVDGGWYAYHPVGGAITVLAKDGARQRSAAPAPLNPAKAGAAASLNPAKASTAGSLNPGKAGTTGSLNPAKAGTAASLNPAKAGTAGSLAGPKAGQLAGTAPKSSTALLMGELGVTSVAAAAEGEGIEGLVQAGRAKGKGPVIEVISSTNSSGSSRDGSCLQAGQTKAPSCVIEEISSSSSSGAPRKAPAVAAASNRGDTGLVKPWLQT